MVGQEGGHAAPGGDVGHRGVTGGEGEIQGLEVGVGCEEGDDDVLVLGGEDGAGGVDQYAARLEIGRRGFEDGGLDGGQARRLGEILMADLGLFGDHAQPRAGHVAEHAIGFADEGGVGVAGIPLVGGDDGDAQSLGTRTNEGELAFM